MKCPQKKRSPNDFRKDRVVRLLKQLYNDQRGQTAGLGLVLVTVLTAIGAIAGLTTYRDHVLQQFGDVSVALRNLRQTYKYEVAIDANRDGDTSDPDDCVLSGSFEDIVDLVDTPGDEPACMNLLVAPTGE